LAMQLSLSNAVGPRAFTVLIHLLAALDGAIPELPGSARATPKLALSAVS